MQFLSDDWLNLFCEADRPSLGSTTGKIAIKIEGGPDGKTCHVISLEDGQVVGAELAPAKGTDIELIAPYELAADLFRGAVDPAAEYMRGRLKMSGDMILWLEVLPLISSADAVSARADVGAATTF